jgi:hypothetical protein
MMLDDVRRLMPDDFLMMADLAPEWSLARTRDELVLYIRRNGEIQMYLGPNRFWCSERQLSIFHFRLKSRVLRGREEK